MNNSPEDINKDLQEIINVVADGVNVIIKNLKDGFQYTDIFALIPVFGQIPEAIKDANNALKYLETLNEEKEEEVIAAVLAKLQDVSESTRNIVKFLLSTLANAYMLYIHISKADVAGGTVK